MKTLPAVAPSRIQLDDDQVVPDDLVGRLYNASDSDIAGIVANFSSRQRAHLAMFFYRKAHLERIGLRIAASCERADLIEAWGVQAGDALFAQAHDRRAPPDPLSSRRPKITLAKLPAFNWTPPTVDVDDDEPDGLECAATA
jgi:hypothetical protein